MERRMWNKRLGRAKLTTMLNSCVILHNMIIEEDRMTICTQFQGQNGNDNEENEDSNDEDDKDADDENAVSDDEEDEDENDNEF
uniref:Uncharacterized protein n=1 Tax=Lactuca sativa TaxID=4236 RepID=A0A9R1X1K7_LACSA|nr:hypothetical protein LSAT_V11C700357540 [Lactuca sativa]